jgi:glycine/D-amino acid oxidase-like deaminating enzyme/nitrite reductase/ring-hydroxylating ferredoxin subunit
VRDEQIACDFMRVPGLLIPGTNAAADELEREHEATKRAGLATDSLDDFHFGKRLQTGALRFADQAQFHPLRYLGGLAQACTRAGARIHTHTRAREVHGGKQATVKLDDGSELRCNAIVVATNSPFNDRVAIHTKQAAYRTFVIAIRTDADLDVCLIWDTEDPYHYVRTWRDEQNNATWLIVGGEDHKTGQPEDEQGSFSRLHDWTRERLGIDGDVHYSWSGQILEPNDGLAFIGRNPMDADNVFIVTGDSGNGLTHGTIASMLLTDLIAGRSNPWTELYSPSRRHGVGEFIRENANVAAQYAELATSGDAPNLNDIATNAGAVVRKGLHKVAAFRDADGVLHTHAATCTHLGCIVHWNSVEKTWDCPCHGSRFDPVDGHVLNGPAAGPLRAVDDGQTH